MTGYQLTGEDWLVIMVLSLLGLVFTLILAAIWTFFRLLTSWAASNRAQARHYKALTRQMTRPTKTRPDYAAPIMRPLSPVTLDGETVPIAPLNNPDIRRLSN